MSATTPVRFGAVTPVLRVSDVAKSLAYYMRVLGFSSPWNAPGFACVQRGDCTLFLCEGDQGHMGGWVWIAVGDADALHEELRAAGAFIRHAPTNYPWGSRELHVADPDGNVLRLGSDRTAGEPDGEWLDMYGRRWRRDGDGKRARMG